MVKLLGEIQVGFGLNMHYRLGHRGAIMCASVLLVSCAETTPTWNELLAETDKVAMARIEVLSSVENKVAKYHSAIMTNSATCRDFLLRLKNVKGKREFVPLTGDTVRCFFLGHDGREVLYLSVNMDGFTVLLSCESKNSGDAVRDDRLARQVVQFAKSVIAAGE